MTVVAAGDPGEVYPHCLPQLCRLSARLPAHPVASGGGLSGREQPPYWGGRACCATESESGSLTTGDVAPVWCAPVQTLQSEGIFPLRFQMHT